LEFAPEGLRVTTFASFILAEVLAQGYQRLPIGSEREEDADSGSRLGVREPLPRSKEGCCYAMYAFMSLRNKTYENKLGDSLMMGAEL